MYCGKPKRIKDIRTKCVQTVFGAFRFRGRRYKSCGCRVHPDGYRQDFPLGEIIPRRTTPEVRYLFAELGARMPYRAASRILKVCGFGDMRASHMAICRHTVAIGRELEIQRLDHRPPIRQRRVRSLRKDACSKRCPRLRRSRHTRFEDPRSSHSRVAAHKWYCRAAAAERACHESEIVVWVQSSQDTRHPTS
jgi:hypothetical protein